MNRPLSYILLLVMVLVLSPKDLWHDHSCKEGSSSLEWSYNSEKADADECSYCDFDLSQAVLPLAYNAPQKAKVLFVFIPQSTPQFFPERCEVLQLRGPPQNFSI